MLLSTSEWSFYLISLLLLASLSFALAYTLLPMVIRRARRWGLLDQPSGRKIHAIPTPRLGGLGIAPALWIGCSFSLLVGTLFISQAWAETYSRAVTGLLLGCSGMFLLGLFDDIKSLKAQHKLIVQIAIALMTLHFLPVPDSLFGIAASSELSRLFIAAWLILIPNSVNLLDGVDGLTGTLVGLFLTVISLMAVITGQYSWLLLTVPIMGAIMGFLKFNWSPAKIFLGDSGSLSLGFLVAYLSIYFSFTGSPQLGFELNPLLAILLTLVWVLDTSFAIARRYIGHMPSLKLFLRRSKAKYLAFHGFAFRKILSPDQGHIHHQLRRAGLRSTQIVALISLFSFVGMIASTLVLGTEVISPLSSANMIGVVSLFSLMGLGFFALCCRILFQPAKADTLSKNSAKSNIAA